MVERNLNEGDILVSSWGWEQTNVDYYVVTRLVGKTSVEINRIGQNSTPTGYMTGTCTPDPSVRIGQPIVKRAKGDMVRLSNYQAAFKCAPDNVERWSSYA